MNQLYSVTFPGIYKTSSVFFHVKKQKLIETLEQPFFLLVMFPFRRK